MATRSDRIRAERKKDAAAKKVVFRGAGGAIFGKDPIIKNKAEADRVISVMLGRSAR